MEHSTRSSSPASSETDSAVSYSSNEPEPILYTRQKVDRRPKSTWHLKPRSEQSLAEYVFTLFHKESLHEVKPLTLDRNVVPRASVLKENAQFLPMVLVPLVIQEIVYRFLPQFGNWSTAFASLFYGVGFMTALLTTLARMDRQCIELGTFDEKNCGRDRCPDADVNQAALGLALTPLIRLGGVFFFWWSATKDFAPSANFTWTFPIRAILFFIVDDLCFYTYHRASHEVPWLWYIHQKHHTTRHPSANLSILADQIQEVIEILLVPLITSLTIPMTFHELFVTLSYVMFAELVGHTGMRQAVGHPILHPFIQPLGMDIILEDHDLHHRRGKSGTSYGKQSRIWDVLFGTAGERVECFGM